MKEISWEELLEFAMDFNDPLNPEAVVESLAYMIKAEQKNGGYINIEAGFCDVVFGGRAAPVMVLKWEGPFRITALGMEIMRRYSLAQPVKKSRYHKWPHKFWHTNNIKVKIHYTETGNIPTIRMWIFIDNPKADRKQRELMRQIPLVEDVVIKCGPNTWFPWKALYQECGYFVIAPGGLGYRDENGRILYDPVFHAKVPCLVVSNIDYMEVAPWERIQTETERGRQIARQALGKKKGGS